MRLLVLTLSACTFVTDAEWQKRLEAECSDLSGFEDADGDGYGGVALSGCEAAGAIATGGDCDDADAAINPGAAEIYYDGKDQNCDGDVGDDQDGDGWPVGSDCMDSVADPVPTVEGDCAPPTFTPDPATIHPGVNDEPYDGVDADCSGTTDFDVDEDGWRSCEDCDDLDRLVNPDIVETWHDGIDQDCDGNDDDEDVDGFVLADDCDDQDASVNPGAIEVVYNEVDEDCDPTNDWDADLDGYDLGVDCDDADATRNPRAVEIWYDGIDQDCDGVDDDQDGDGVDLVDDCDDTDVEVGPGAPEVWYDGVDQDCDGNDRDQDYDGFDVDVDCDDTAESVFSGAVELWYDGVDQDCDGNDDDQDLDGWPLALDCDDLRAAVRPDGQEDCATDYDDDCDGRLDAQDAVDCVLWFVDGDGDSFGGTETTCWCDVDVGRTATSDDCDDGDNAVHPEAQEDCATSWDDNCDGEVNDLDALGCTDFHADRDGDGLGDPSGICRCEIEPDLTTDTRDCDDEDAAIGLAPSWHADVDHDGLGDDSAFVEACTLPLGASTVGGDCDDHDAAVLGPTPWFLDADGDGYGADATGFIACDGAGATALGSDCDDASVAVNPGATEDCSTPDDDDCSGTTNDEGALGGDCWHLDADRDGYGSDACHVLCHAEGDIDAIEPGDCDDGTDTVSPEATDICDNGIDEDCSPLSCVLSGAAGVSSGDAVLYGQAAGDTAGRALAAGTGGLLMGGGGTGRVWLWNGALAGPASLSGAWLRVTGAYPYEGLGDAVGFGDAAGRTVLVGGSRVSSSFADGGVALLFDAGLTGDLTAFDATWELQASSGGQGVGASVTAAGDLSADSVDDPWVAIGAPGYAGTGAVALVALDRGGALRMEDADQLVVGVEANGELGRAVVGDMDLDGDGVDDVVMSAPRAGGGLGAVYLLDDPSVVSVADLTRVISGTGGGFGQALAVGAFDESGVLSLVVGAPELGGGAAFVLPAEATGTGDALATFTDGAAGDAFGRSIATADEDGDGVDDLAFGVQADGWVGTDGGAALFYRGPLLGSYLATDPTGLRYGESAGDNAGSAVAGLPDWNADGREEWAVAVPGADNTAAEAGAIGVFFGSGD